MENGRWSRDRYQGFRLGVDGLIAISIRGFVFTGDVWRQGHVSQLLYGHEEILDRAETKRSLAEFSTRSDFCLKLAVFTFTEPNFSSPPHLFSLPPPGSPLH